MKVKPLYDRILAQRLDQEERTKGGIIIPETAKEKPLEGRVVAVGTGLKDSDGKSQPLDVSEGDHILFGKYAGTEIRVDGQDYLILQEDDILALIVE